MSADLAMVETDGAYIVLSSDADFTDVLKVDAIAVKNIEEDLITVFAVNRDMEADNLLEVDLRGFNKVISTEHEVMSGYDVKKENTFSNPGAVIPRKYEKPKIERTSILAKLSSLSWNMIKIKLVNKDGSSDE